MKRSHLRLHIRQLCCLGLPGEQLMPSLLKAVRQLVNADSAGFFWVNPSGHMTSLYAERMLPANAMRVYFERFYDSCPSSFRHSFTQRAQELEPVTAMTPTPAFEHTEYYNEVLRPLQAHHVMYGIVRDQGQALGQVSLYRPKSEPQFSAAERSELTTLMRYITHGVSQGLRVGASECKTFADAQDEAVLLVGLDGEIRQASVVAQRLLFLAIMGEINRDAVLAGLADAARPKLCRLGKELRAKRWGEDTVSPSLTIDNKWGRFCLRAYSLCENLDREDAVVAIRIQRQEPMLLKFVNGLSKLQLSPQQREIALGLAKGSSNRELAETMGVSINTVAYHVKQLFQKLDSHDRQQVIAKVVSGELQH